VIFANSSETHAVALLKGIKSQILGRVLPAPRSSEENLESSEVINSRVRDTRPRWSTSSLNSSALSAARRELRSSGWKTGTWPAQNLIVGESGTIDWSLQEQSAIHYYCVTMNEFIPKGYISVREALDCIGRRLFPSDWTGEEHKARRGLISEDEWLKIKDVPRARGSGAPGSRRETAATSVAVATPHSTGDPSSALYQKEYGASQRYTQVRDRLRVMLEAGDLEAVILDPFTGTLHRPSTAMWRRSDVDRMIKKGQAPILGSRNIGSLLVKAFEARAPTRPIPGARLEDVIKALREKTEAERLTRAEQKDFIRKSFPTYRITERQFIEIFRAIPTLIGRPKKSDEKL
jgi:hypothetical protein